MKRTPTAVSRLDYRSIGNSLASRAEDVCQHLWPEGKRVGNNWCVGDVQGTAATGGGSFKVCLSGSKAGVCKDFATGEKGFDLLEGWSKSRSIPLVSAAKEAVAWLGLGAGQPTLKSHHHRSTAPSPIRKPEKLRRLNVEYNRKLRKRLLETPAAVEYLHNRGLTDKTIELFHLGLSIPYTAADGTVQGDSLVYPVRIHDGGFVGKYGYYNIPGLSLNPIDDNGWMKGAVQCYYATKHDGQSSVFVCEGIKDVWRHYQALQEAGLDQDLLIVSSTHGSGDPDAWKDPEWWASFDNVYLGHDNDDSGEQHVERLLNYVGREVLRVRVPKEIGKDWTDFWNSGGTIEEFQSLLDEATPAVNPIKELVDDPLQTGRLSFNPVDINGAYVGGHLYYPTEILRRSWVEDENGERKLAEWAETIVVRSDRTDWGITQAFAPNHVANAVGRRRLLKLTDGTILAKQPKASAYNTWDWGSIQAFLNGKERVRPLLEIVSEAHQILRKAVWLPYEEDYAVLALMIPATFVQRVFEAVPLFLLNGAPGTGKTQMANVISKMAFNGNVIGQVSAATAARHIDDCRGFVVLDDLEAIGSKGGKDAAQFNELVQALKVSYNQNSAVKIWTDVKTMRTEKLDFFGIKMINNTLGTDSILGSRMIKIQTRKVPEGFSRELKDLSADDEIRMHEIRQELHTWAFVNVESVRDLYVSNYRHHTDRKEEISAPLRVMAALVGDETLQRHLEAALARQTVQLEDPDDPTEVLREAVRNLIKAGYDTVTLTHVSLEMRTLLDANFGQSSTTEIPEWARPEWVGRRLRTEDLVEPVDAGRTRIWGKQLRVVKLAKWLMEEVKQKIGMGATQQPIDAFCQGCANCPYRNAGCPIMDARLKQESRKDRGGSQ